MRRFRSRQPPRYIRFTLSAVVLSAAFMLAPPGHAQQPQTVTVAATLPASLETSGMLRHLLETMWVRSRSFREQCARLERAPVTIVLTRGRLAESASAGARTDFRRPNGELRAEIVVSFERPAKLVELIAHELEHVIEQLDGVKLIDRAEDGVSLATDTAYETIRATVIGERVAREFQTAPAATVLSVRR